MVAQAETGKIAMERSAAPRAGISLSTRLLAMTVVFVVLAEVLIYVPAITSFRNNWLIDRLSSARTAALVLEAAPADMIPEGLVNELLNSVGAMAIAMKIKDTRRLLALSEEPPMTRRSYDMRDMRLLTLIRDSFDTLLFGDHRAVRVIGWAPMGGDFIEIAIDETPLRQAMLRFSGTILMVSLLISALTAVLIYLALNGMIVRPVRRLAKNITQFAARPDDATRIIVPSGRSDEIGQAEYELASMQTTLVQQLRQRQRLAELGLAVSKINHDLRNLLTSAQLMSDRLASVAEPTVQRFAPKLIAALDRAISFCESTLAYGRVQEAPPAPRPTNIATLVEEVHSLLPLNDQTEWQTDIDPGLTATIDPDYLFRVLLNLSRNAVQALEREPCPDPAADRIMVKAACADHMLRMTISDTGPGIPLKVRERLFEAFQGSGRPGSTGLGLAIAADLVRGHGGSIRLIDDGAGTTFAIELPCPNGRGK